MPDERRLSNWLRTYVEDWTIEAEPPELFHLWTGIGVLSTALGRKVKLSRGNYNLYPNCYIILIAGSAKCRKSTALRMGVGLLDELEIANSIKITRNKITPERLVEVLGKMKQVEMKGTSAEFISRGSEALIYAPELTTLLDMNSHKSGLIAILTDLYDCPNRWENETKNKGYDHLYDVFLNILGATTPKEFGSVIPPQAIGSGFMSRTVLVFQRTTNRRNPHPDEFYNSPEAIKLKEGLIHDIRIIHALGGDFVWGPEVKDIFAQWYMGFQEPEDERMEGYMGRKDDHAIKVAMVLSASMSDNLIIEKQHLLAAISLLDQVEKYMSGVYSLLSGTENVGDDIRWVLKKMVLAGGSIGHSDLLKGGWYRFNAKSFGEVMQTMIDSKIVDRSYGRKQKIIYTLLDEDMAKEILFD